MFNVPVKTLHAGLYRAFRKAREGGTECLAAIQIAEAAALKKDDGTRRPARQRDTFYRAAMQAVAQVYGREEFLATAKAWNAARSEALDEKGVQR